MNKILGSFFLFKIINWKEMAFACRFALIGGIATFIHMVFVSIFIYKTSLPILTVNLIAFLLAFGISFSGNYYWTFRKTCRPDRAIRRFFLIATSAFFANSILLSVLLNAGLLSPISSALTAALIIPSFTYLASRLWAFSEV
jgi:putative flippase GtrA